MADKPTPARPARSKLAAALIFVIAEVRGTTQHRPAEVLACCILFLMAANLFSVAARKSLTNDEIVHIPSGYRYLTSGKFRLNAEHPPLIKMWACLPLLIVRPKMNSLIEPADEDFGQFTMRSAIDFWNLNHDRFRIILFWARFPMVLLTLALGALIFIYARQLFGSRAAVLSLTLFSVDPTMLAHGRIVHTDIAAALGGLLFLLALQTYCRAPTFARAFWFSVATGFALLTKFSMVIVAPVFLLALAYVFWKAPRLETSRRRIALQAGVAALVVLTLINAAYYYQHPTLAPADVDWITANAITPFTAARVTRAIKVLSGVFPTYYLFGLYTVVVHNHFGHPTALLGNYGDLGWWYYFPVAFALKSTVPFLLLSLAAVIWATWAGIFRREKNLIPLLVAATIYLAISMTSHINIGIRHIAPVFPFLFLLGGTYLDRLLKSRGKTGGVLTVGLLGVMVISAVRAYPKYLTFTSALTFGKPGWQLLSDSNVEWGEDVGELAAYLHAHGETKLVGALSGGVVIPAMYDVQLLDFAPPDIKSSPTRYVAIGAGFLNGSNVPRGLQDASGAVISEEQRRNYFASYRTASAEAVFGNSIYLYRARE